MDERSADHDPMPAEGVWFAADIGNSRMKVGRFERPLESAENALPIPTGAAEFAIEHASGSFDDKRFFAWCDAFASHEMRWSIGSVHRAAAEHLNSLIATWAKRTKRACQARQLTYRDVPLEIQVDHPERVGIDRLLAAVGANRIRSPGTAAIIVDLGSAITVDLLTAGGAFTGGAILPGIAMSARALAEQTDALPHLALDALEKPPGPLGKTTATAIEAGLYWGAVGAIRELISQISKDLCEPPEVFLTGGASPQVASLLNDDHTVRHVANLVLAGNALVADASCK